MSDDGAIDVITNFNPPQLTSPIKTTIAPQPRFCKPSLRFPLPNAITDFAVQMITKITTKNPITTVPNVSNCAWYFCNMLIIGCITFTPHDYVIFILYDNRLSLVKFFFT